MPKPPRTRRPTADDEHTNPNAFPRNAPLRGEKKTIAGRSGLRKLPQVRKAFGFYRFPYYTQFAPLRNMPGEESAIRSIALCREAAMLRGTSPQYDTR